MIVKNGYSSAVLRHTEKSNNRCLQIDGEEALYEVMQWF